MPTVSHRRLGGSSTTQFLGERAEHFADADPAGGSVYRVIGAASRSWPQSRGCGWAAELRQVDYGLVAS